MADDGEAAVYSDEEFAELLGFLSDQKLEVQRFAAEGVLAQTESQAFLDYCRREPRKAAKPLLRLAEKAEADGATSEKAASVAAASGGGALGEKAARQAAFEAMSASGAGSAALQALVNISGVPTVCDELVALSAPRRAAEAMKGGWLEGRSGFAHWYAMLLANLTTSKAGQEAICADESLLRFLLAAFVSKPRPPKRDGFEDPLINLGKVLCNACALEEGRKLLARGEPGASVVATLCGELSDRARRPDIVAALRNLCLDSECHSAVIAADAFAPMARFLYPWDKVDAENRAKLPDDLSKALASEGSALTGEVPVRYASAICVLGLCRSQEGREYLRSRGAVEVLRAWQAEEPDEDTRSALERASPALTAPEGEDAGAASAEGADAEGTAAGGAAAEGAGEAPAPAAAAGPIGGAVLGEAPPRVGPGPLPKRDAGPGGDGEIVDLFAGIEDGDEAKK